MKAGNIAKQQLECRMKAGNIVKAVRL